MNNSHKTLRLINYILIAAAMLCLVYYYGHRTIFLKGFTSFWFVLLGLVNLINGWKSRNRAFLLLLETGLILSAAADVILWDYFLLGAGVFALGHLFYFGAFCALERFHPRDLICIGITAVISLGISLGTPFIRTEGITTWILTVYALVISCMLGKNIANLLRKKTRSRWLMLIGCTLFWFSDLMLAIFLFGSGSRMSNFLCMFTYWPGQSILAHSMFHLPQEE